MDFGALHCTVSTYLVLHPSAYERYICNKKKCPNKELICYEASLSRFGAMNLNLVVPNVEKLKIEWFHSNTSQKFNGSFEPLSKIEWFHRTTGTITNAGPAINLVIVRQRHYESNHISPILHPKLEHN